MSLLYASTVTVVLGLVETVDWEELHRSIRGAPLPWLDGVIGL